MTTPPPRPWPASGDGAAAAVFSAPIARLSDYSALTAEIGISQAPAVVIVGKSGKARLIEGFIDEETLKQEVADSR